jgi:hypothetical protein
LSLHSIDDGPPNPPNPTTFNILTAHAAHVTDIYSIAVTPTQIISASGLSSLKVHTTTEPHYPLAQSLDGAHKLGCHHVVTSRDGKKAASTGFGGELQTWTIEDSRWAEAGKIVGARFFCTLRKPYPEQKHMLRETLGRR